MFAIFGKFPALSCDALTAKYKNSAYMVLDLHSSNHNIIQDTNIQEATNNYSVQGEDVADCDFEYATTVWQQKAISTNNGPACRELLDDLRQLAFLVEYQPEFLANLRNSLSKLPTEVNAAVQQKEVFLYRSKKRKVGQSF